jgi:hypothetical protein
MTSPTSVDPQVLEDLVDANHILFNKGVVDAFGHVSVRHDKRPDRFLLARNMAPALVRADDIQEFSRPTTHAASIWSASFTARSITRART